ncbi:inverse autotransporter beta domain-containing protein [Planctomicrobium sp. SH668]|uniref:inverse autotransporter beta domain-containing protein n=1 Tax=Planctomicrobium sp. SH668 TaxID=3448126 RepID=UPI003F5BEEFE
MAVFAALESNFRYFVQFTCDIVQIQHVHLVAIERIKVLRELSTFPRRFRHPSYRIQFEIMLHPILTAQTPDCSQTSGRRSFRATLSLFTICLVWMLNKPVFAQESFVDPAAEEQSGSLSFPDTATNNVNVVLPPDPDDVDRVLGLDGQIGFIGLKAFGRQDSIVPLELFPYVLGNNEIFFGDMRGFINMEGKFGGNFGLGYRFIDPTDTALFGVNGFYDVDTSSGSTFHQLSVGWEARMRMAGFSGNVYMPVGNKEKIIEQSIIDPRFDENHILFDVRSKVGKALTGLDVNFSAYLPGELMQEHQVEALAGWYHFQGDDQIDDVNGMKFQLQGYVVPSLQTMTSITHDQLYGTNFNIGVSWRFGTRELPTTSLHGQLRRFVNRNYNVILAKRTDVESDVIARKADGSAIIVQHVDSTNTGGTGAFDNPYSTIGDAQADALRPDLIFVHKDSVLNESVVVGDNQVLLAEGSDHRYKDPRYGWFNVPGGNNPGGETPRIVASGGDAVLMGNNSTINGFQISNSGGRGIVAIDKSNVRVANVTVENTSDDAIFLESVESSYLTNVKVEGSGGNGITIKDIDDYLGIDDLQIKDVAGDGVHIDGGMGEIYFAKSLLIEETQGAAFRVQNMESLTEVDDKGTTSVLDDVTTVTPSIVAIENLIVRNGGGGFGEGIVAENNEGLISFTKAEITTEGATAVKAVDTNGILIGNGLLTAKNARALDFEDSSVIVNLTSINADGGDHAIRMKNTKGTVSVFGTGSTLSSGGTIKNTDVAILIEDSPEGYVGLQLVDFKDNDKVAVVDTGNTLAISRGTISGTTTSFIEATNLNSLQIAQNTFVDNTITSGVGILFNVDKEGSYNASIGGNLVSALPGTFFEVNGLAGSETASLIYAFQSNAIDLSNTTGSAAATLNWTGPLVANILGNNIVGSGTGQSGFRITTGVGSALSQVQVSGNKFKLSGINGIAIDADMESPVNFFVDSNQFDMNGANQTAVRAKIGKASGIGMAGNKIVDYAGGGTGILFTSIHDKSVVALDNNSIDLSRFNTFVDRGIIVDAFTTDTVGATPVVKFHSTKNNTITGATTPYAFPASGGSGKLLINGSTFRFE